MNPRIRQALRNESGAALVDSLIGAIVSALLFGVVAGGITIMLLQPPKQAAIAETTGLIAAADALFRADVRAAGTITTTDCALSMTLPGQACDEVVWTAEGEGTLKLIRTECPGESAEDRQIVSADAGDVRFGYSGGVATLVTRFAGHDGSIKLAERTQGAPAEIEGTSAYHGMRDLREGD